MAVEGKGGPRPIWEKIEQEVGAVSSDAKTEVRGSSESRAEELFALWQDHRRILKEVAKFDRGEQAKEREDQTYKVQEFSDPVVLGQLENVKRAITERWHDPETQKLFKDNMQRSIDEETKTRVGREDFEKIKSGYEQHTAERDKLYQQIFKHRDKDPDELTQIRVAELSGEMKSEHEKLEDAEGQSPELAARLSFERLKDYRKQLSKDGFIWTPSREEYFNQIVDHLVVVNQNRPLLLTGETGTGKTVMARAVAKRLTGKGAYEVGEEAKTDIRPLLGSRMVDNERGTYVIYGQLGQALTGKKSSLDTEADTGGIFYMDEMNGYPPDALRSLVKQISGRRTGEEVSFAAWHGAKEKLSQNFGFLGSANLASEKHPDRADLPVEVARELGELEVDYPPQTPDNPELYEMMLVALMDQNSRIRLPSEELAPEYEDLVNTATNEKHKELKTQPEAGGTLWRFANLVSDVQRSYKGEDSSLTPTERDASYLRSAVLDPGLVISWLQAYRKSASRQDIDLQTFLADKLQKWSDQKKYPEEDRNLLRKFIAKFNLETPGQKLHYEQTILSPSEIGALSPRVPREAEALKDAPRPAEASVFLPDGTEILYNPETQNPTSGSRWVKKTDRRNQPWIFKGFALGDNSGKAVMENAQGETNLVHPAEFRRGWEALSLVFTERFENKDIKLDVLETKQLWEKFYTDHNLQEFAQNLPKEIKFSAQGEARIREALKMGFDRAMILPPTATQDQFRDQLSTEMASGYPNPDKFWSEKAKNAPVRNRPAKAYMVLYSSRPIPQETKGLTQPLQEELFRQKKWDGTTFAEFRMQEKMNFEATGNHDLYAYKDNADESNWARYLDSADSSGAVDAYWRPGNRWVDVSWDDAEASAPRLGARPAVVVEIL